MQKKMQKASLSYKVCGWDSETGGYIPVPDFEARLIERAIEIIREPVYKFNNVFDWKEAA